MGKLHILALALAALMAAACGQDGRSIRDAISGQMADYPESRVQDIYKSFCQDNLGPEHLIPNPDAAREYLLSELGEYRSDLAEGKYTKPAKRYEPVGDEGNYIRVELSVILDSLVTENRLLEAFVSSANAGQNMTPDQWAKKWQKVAAVIRRDFPGIPDAERDLLQIDSLISEGHLILHHSPVYEAAYHPHYRIIARDIFEKDLKPLL